MSTTESVVRTARKADLNGVATVHVASFQDAYRGILPDARLDGMTIAGSLKGWVKTFQQYPENIDVSVYNENTVLGFCCAGPVVDLERNAPYLFEVYGIHVSPTLRGRGIGKQLLHRSFERARRRHNFNNAIVWTLGDLALSRAFYEREGGIPVKSGIWKVADLSIPEIAYGWNF